jgi:biotin carboxyl carrier protein
MTIGYPVSLCRDLHDCASGVFGMAIEIEVPELSALPGDRADAEAEDEEPQGPRITALHFDEGEEIAKGDVLAIISNGYGAIEVASPASGTVTEIRIEEGDPVEPEDIIAVLEPE